MWFLLSAVFPPSLRLEENANLKVELGKLAVFREEIMEGGFEKHSIRCVDSGLWPAEKVRG